MAASSSLTKKPSTVASILGEISSGSVASDSVNRYFSELSDAVKKNDAEANAVFAWIAVSFNNIAKPNPANSIQERLAFALLNIEELRELFPKDWPTNVDLFYLMSHLVNSNNHSIFEHLVAMNARQSTQLGATRFMMSAGYLASSPTVVTEGFFKGVIHHANIINQQARFGLRMAQFVACDLVLSGNEHFLNPLAPYFFPTAKIWQNLMSYRTEFKHDQFDFKEAVAFMKKRAEIMGEFIHNDSLKHEEKLLKENKPHQCFKKAIDLCDIDPKEAYFYLRTSAEGGNANALYIFSLLILRMHNEFKNDVFEYQRGGTDRDAIADSLLKNKEVCDDLTKTYSNKKSKEVAREILKDCVQFNFIYRYCAPRRVNLRYLRPKDSPPFIHKEIKASQPQAPNLPMDAALREKDDNAEEKKHIDEFKHAVMTTSSSSSPLTELENLSLAARNDNVEAAEVLGWMAAKIGKVGKPNPSNSTAEQHAARLLTNKEIEEKFSKEWLTHDGLSHLLYVLRLGRNGRITIFTHLIELGVEKDIVAAVILQSMLYINTPTATLEKNGTQAINSCFTFINESAAYGLPIAQLLASELIFSGEKTFFNPFIEKYPQTKEKWLFFMSYQPELRFDTFGFEEAMYFRRRRREIAGELIDKDYLEDENKQALEKAPAGCFLKVVDLHLTHPREAYIHLRDAAENGNPNARYIFSLLILRLHNKFEAKIFEHQKGGSARDNIAEVLLKDSDVRNDLNTFYLNKESRKLAEAILKSCVKDNFQYVEHEVNRLDLRKLRPSSSPIDIIINTRKSQTPDDIKHQTIMRLLSQYRNEKNTSLYKLQLINLKNLAEQGHGPAQFDYGRMIADKEPCEAFQWVEKSAFNNSHGGCETLLALCAMMETYPDTGTQPESHYLVARKLIKPNLELLETKYANYKTDPLFAALKIKANLSRTLGYSSVHIRTQLSAAEPISDSKKATSTSSTQSKRKKKSSSERVLSNKAYIENQIDPRMKSRGESVGLFAVLAKESIHGLDINSVLAYLIYLAHCKEPARVFEKRDNIFFNPEISLEYQVAHRILQSPENRVMLKAYDNTESLIFARDQLLLHIENVSKKKFPNLNSKQRSAREHAFNTDKPSTCEFIQHQVATYLAKKSPEETGPSTEIHASLTSQSSEEEKSAEENTAELNTATTIAQDEETELKTEAIDAKPKAIEVKAAVEKTETTAEEKINSPIMTALRVIMELSYNEKIVSKETLTFAEIKENLSNFAKNERTSTFWRFICKGFMDGKGEVFFHHLRTLGLFDALFPSLNADEKLNSDHKLNHFAERVRHFDTFVAARRDAPAANWHLFSSILIAKELKENEIVNQYAVDIVTEAYKMPLVFLQSEGLKGTYFENRNAEYNKEFLVRVSRERDKFFAPKMMPVAAL